MRTLAWVWVAKGLFNWAVVLGVNSALRRFHDAAARAAGDDRVLRRADLLAAVGLWLAAPWGGVLWLLCAVIEAISPVLGARGASSASSASPSTSCWSRLFRPQLGRELERD